MVTAWGLLASESKLYVRALFVTAPWIGLYVLFQWELDFFKVGLFFAPIMLIRTRPVPKNRLPVMLATGLGLLAFAHWTWQLVSGEVLRFGIIESAWRLNRLTVGFGMLLLRLALFAYLLGALRSTGEAVSCLRWYSGSMFVLSCYGLLQEAAWLLGRTPITPIYRAGVLSQFTEFATVWIGSSELLRIHSFCREPKDFALFATPAIAFLGSQFLLNPRVERHGWQLVVIVTAALLTLSSSLLLVLPFILFTMSLIAPKLRVRRMLWLVALAVAFWPMWSAFSRERILGRFHGYEDLLQVSRERPALDFWRENLPRSLLGYGIGAQAYYLPSWMPPEFVSSGVYAGMDSFWLSMLFDLGLPGLVLMAGIVFHLLRRRPLGQEALPLRAAAIAAALASIPLQGDLRSAVLWLMLAAAFGATAPHVSGRRALGNIRASRAVRRVPAFDRSARQLIHAGREHRD